MGCLLQIIDSTSWGQGMGLQHAVFAVTGLVAAVGISAIGYATDIGTSDDPMVRLADVLLHTGLPGTLTAEAAENFGLEYRDYPEKYVEIKRPDGTHRVIEVVTDKTVAHIFFSQQTGAEIITVRSGPSGEFVTGLQRENDSSDTEELSGNQGRAFMEMQKTYWLTWLTGAKE